MRILFWSINMAVVAVAGFVNPADLGLSISVTDYEFTRSMILMIIAMILVLEGLYVFMRDRLKEDGPSKAEYEVLEQSRNAAVNQLEEQQEKTTALQSTVANLEKELAKARGELAKQTTAKGDAEVMNFLALLQSKGRFVDFLMDDVSQYPDQQVGAAARVVHQGCVSVVKDYFDIEPLENQSEGETVTLEPDYNSYQYKVLGNVRGEPPYTGRILHRGWKTDRISLPKGAEEALLGSKVIAPAEVEIH